MKYFIKVLLAINILVPFSIHAQSSFQAPSSIQLFFSNYEFLKVGWEKFVEEQSKILSSNLITVVRDHRGTAVYRGHPGYFKSIQDWSSSFKTDSDFNFKFQGENNGKYLVTLHGTIIFTNNGVPLRIREGKHCWQELFNLDRSGKISSLEVNMNLNCNFGY